ncbi:MurR/RpiR family transcriptional regulator [Metabacillus litoralis]|uniref:MurR/RpiR family transcriptional regulator n=1 Tax=Metabacillus litoralis TaxID=152268 RepID=A0A5C6VX86_9BACI|nr:MurR/RpiR family transcriptional regulator [Metabacillus litoralis]TXC89549.1 MurR/RpiR family transcriptional regulator [Metabacillus litoralis]
MEFNWNIETMSPKQYKIADYIQKNTHRVLLSTEQEIAEAVKVSIASVSRFWRIVGFKNLKDFKVHLSSQLEVSPAGKFKNVMRKVEDQELQHHTLSLSINHLYKTIEELSENSFQQTIELLSNANKVYIHCPGPSIGLGELMTYRMARFGIDIRLINKGGSELFESIMHLRDDDVFVLFGFIRLLPEAKVLLDYSKEIGTKTILITDQLVSDFTREADVVLFASRGEMRDFHSMIAPTYLIENLIIALGMKAKEDNVKRLNTLGMLRKRYSTDLPR